MNNKYKIHAVHRKRVWNFWFSNSFGHSWTPYLSQDPFTSFRADTYEWFEWETLFPNSSNITEWSKEQVKFVGMQIRPESQILDVQMRPQYSSVLLHGSWNELRTVFLHRKRNTSEQPFYRFVSSSRSHFFIPWHVQWEIHYSETPCKI